MPSDVKEKYMNLQERINKDIPFSVFFETLIDYELLLLNSNSENNHFGFEFNNTFFVLYTKKYSYDLEKDINQSVVHVKDYVLDKYNQWVESYSDKLKIRRGVSYTLLDTIISVVGFEIEKDTRFKMLFEDNFKKHYKFSQ